MAGSMTGMTETEYRDMMVGGGRSINGNRFLGEDGREPTRVTPCVSTYQRGARLASVRDAMPARRTNDVPRMVDGASAMVSPHSVAMSPSTIDAGTPALRT